MAVIQTDQHFLLAASHLADTGQLPVTGERFIDASARKVYDERLSEPEPEDRLIDVTPSQQALETALDAALLVIAEDNEIEQARDAILAGKLYLRKQLLKASPPTPAAMVAVFKPIVDNNVRLTNMMTNQVAAMNSAFGTAITLNPTTNPTRNGYLIAAEAVIALLT